MEEDVVDAELFDPNVFVDSYSEPSSDSCNNLLNLNLLHELTTPVRVFDSDNDNNPSQTQSHTSQYNPQPLQLLQSSQPSNSSLNLNDPLIDESTNLKINTNTIQSIQSQFEKTNTRDHRSLR